MMLTLKRKLTYMGLTVILLLGSIYCAAYLLGKYYLNETVIKTYFIAEAERRLNRKVSLGDKTEFYITWNLIPYIELYDITIANSKDGSDHKFLTIKQLELELDLWQLFFKNFNILALKLIQPTLNLETKNINSNWDFTPSDKNAKRVATDKQTESKYQVSINEIIVEDGRVSYSDNSKAAPELFIKSLHIESDDGRSEFSIKLDGTYNAADIELNAYANILNEQQIVFKLKTLESGKSKLSGDLEIHTKPLHLKGRFTSPYFSTNDFSTHTENASGEYSIPDINIPTNSFTDSSIDFALEIKQLLLDNLALKNVNIQFTTENNTLQAKLNPPVSLANGKVNADLNYDTKPNLPIINMKISATPLDLQELFNTIMGESPVSGSTLDLTINLNSSGNNLRQIVGNLNGRILAVAGPGQFINSSASIANVFTNILSAMITFKKSETSTAFKCAVVNLNVKNGIATANNGIGLEAVTVNVLGSGNIDLRNGRINFNINPQNVGNTTFDITQFSIAQAITINGTISKPQVNFNPINTIADTAAKTAIMYGLFGQFAIPAEIASIAYNNMNKDATQKGPPACQIALGQ